jgi:hypothetical protein
MRVDCSVFRIRLHLMRRHARKKGSGDGGGQRGRQSGRRLDSRLRSAMRFGRNVVGVIGLSFVRRHVCVLCLLLICFSVCSFD